MEGELQSCQSCGQDEPHVNNLRNELKNDNLQLTQDLSKHDINMKTMTKQARMYQDQSFEQPSKKKSRYWTVESILNKPTKNTKESKLNDKEERSYIGSLIGPSGRYSEARKGVDTFDVSIYEIEKETKIKEILLPADDTTTSFPGRSVDKESDGISHFFNGNRYMMKERSRNNDENIEKPVKSCNEVTTVMLRNEEIVSLVIDGKERLCLAQISNTLLKNFSYNEIHNRRVALGITCVQCTPVQLEILRRLF